MTTTMVSIPILHPELVSLLEEEGIDQASTLTKAQLVSLLVKQIGLHRRDAKELVDSFFQLISDTLIQGEDVKLSGFGNFHVRAKRERPGRNPRTGEAVSITPRHVVTFHASAKLKEQAQQAVLLHESSQTPSQHKADSGV
jgi:integration host factor subunit alpha